MNANETAARAKALNKEINDKVEELRKLGLAGDSTIRVYIDALDASAKVLREDDPDYAWMVEQDYGYDVGDWVPSSALC